MKAKNCILIALLFFLVFPSNLFSLVYSYSKEDTLQLRKPSFWLYYLNANINLSETAYSKWKKGGENQMSWLVVIDHSVKKEFMRIIFENKGKLSYGRTKVSNEPSRKSVDRIEIETIFSGKKKFFSSFFSVKVETQFDEGIKIKGEEEEIVSDFADPLYLTESLGLNFNFSKQFKTRIGISAKEIFTKKYPFWSDDPKTPDKEEKFRFQRGLESVTEWDFSLIKNVQYKSKIVVFSELKDYRNTDVFFDGNINTKLNKYFSIKLEYNMIYDRDVFKQVQMYHILGIGITLNIL